MSSRYVAIVLPTLASLGATFLTRSAEGRACVKSQSSLISTKCLYNSMPLYREIPGPLRSARHKICPKKYLVSVLTHSRSNSVSSATCCTACFSLIPRRSIQAFETTWMGSVRIPGATSEWAPSERSEQAGQWPCSESQDHGRRCCHTVPYALHLAPKSGISKHDIGAVLMALRISRRRCSKSLQQYSKWPRTT